MAPGLPPSLLLRATLSTRAFSDGLTELEQPDKRLVLSALRPPTQGLEQTEACPTPPASQTTSSLSSVCRDAKGLGHSAFPFLQTPSPLLLPLSSPMFLLVFLSCAIPAAVAYFLLLQRSMGELWPFQQNGFPQCE